MPLHLKQEPVIKPAEHPNRIKAVILDGKDGKTEYENVCGIRIHSKDYQLLIMCDFAPIMGEIDGDISFITNDNEYVITDITGYFKHVRNEFVLVKGTRE